MAERAWAYFIGACLPKPWQPRPLRAGLSLETLALLRALQSKLPDRKDIKHADQGS